MKSHLAGGIAPTPGGLGSAEALLGMLLVSATGVEPAVAGVAVLLYRASAVWLPALFGGLVLGWFVVLGDAGGTGGRPESARPGDEPAAAVAGKTTVPRLLVAVAASLAVLTAVALHRGHLVVEPANVLVHVVRDAALVVLSFVLTLWFCRRVPRGWVP